jgi:hypothetical protein
VVASHPFLPAPSHAEDQQPSFPGRSLQASSDMEFDFSKSDESMLSWAIKIIVAAPNLSIEEVAALKCKVDTAETIEKIREGVQKISKPANAWDHFKTARNSLTKWELAFQKPEKDSKRKRSKNEREALKHTKTSFDVSELPSEQFDFLFVLAYCDIGPFGLEKFRQLYKQCSQYASTGADLRQKIDPYMGNHKTLCRLSSSHGYTKKKRGSSAICSQSHEDQNGSNSESKLFIFYRD